jgi:hypothetical protein
LVRLIIDTPATIERVQDLPDCDEIQGLVKISHFIDVLPSSSIIPLLSPNLYILYAFNIYLYLLSLIRFCCSITPCSGGRDYDPRPDREQSFRSRLNFTPNLGDLRYLFISAFLILFPLSYFPIIMIILLSRPVALSHRSLTPLVHTGNPSEGSSIPYSLRHRPARFPYPKSYRAILIG